ncbi:MAG: hypothetical protein GC203_11680 [Phenylobacterium sp.]|uniref:hypothetical protein n=1 Tax=Phenylobacterium sp. TaxID=1871053 RepID=UPI0025CF1781|nr:hypothetical protein [Phenylobacterium sp.]MBI1198513.1 hypothetical protein [Phenylobacterium sp.]
MKMFQTLARTMEPSAVLNIACACGRRVAWTRPEAFSRCGPDTTPPDLRRRLRCGACGRTGQARVWL